MTSRDAVTSCADAGMSCADNMTSSCGSGGDRTAELVRSDSADLDLLVGLPDGTVALVEGAGL